MKRRLNGMLTLLLALVVQITFAQEKTVTGTVTDDQGLPLPGVNVIVQGSNRGVQTDFDGEFSISVNQDQVLVFSYIGFATQEVPVGAGSSINVELDVDAAALEEVVVTGYSTSTKQSFTGSAKTVDAELLNRKNVSNVAQALTGEVAGVRVINNSGQPGSTPNIRIRGIGSVNGNTSPLYVVDGVPYAANNPGTADNPAGDVSLAGINPEDIASTTILKDAAATAIYGARGANGVVVITTRKGRAGRSMVEVSTRTGVNFSLLPRYNTIDSPEQYIALGWEGLYNRGAAEGRDPVAYANANLFSGSGIDPRYNLWNVADGGELIDPETRMVRPGVTRRYDPEDWEDYGFQTSTRTEANLKISGGNETTSYYSSVGYLNDVGYIIDSDFERISGRLNLTHQVKDWLSGSVNMGYSLSETNNNGQSEDSGSVFWFVDNIPSIYPLFLRDADGNIVDDPIYGGPQYDYGQGRGFGALTNSIADANYSGSNSKRHEFNTNAFLKADITDGLSLETRFGTQYYNDSFNSLQNPFYGPSAGQGGSIYKEKTELFTYNFLQLLRYSKSFGGHSIDALVAHESNSWARQTLYVSKNNLIDPDGTELNNAVVSSSLPGSYTDDFTLESFFGQINYNFDDRYFLSGSARRDGSSRFLQDKWDNFGSVSGAWVLSNEGFMQDQGLFTFLKLKASYGLIGEQGGIGFYPGYDRFDIGNLNDRPTFSFDAVGNPDLTWETSKMFQTGVEFSLGRFLDGSVDYYRKNTDDLLFERRIQPSSGRALITVNDGELLNQGIEFDLSAHVIKTTDAYFDISVNGEIIENELLRMPIDPETQEPKVLDQQGLYGRSAGHSIYDFYVRDFVGVDPADGRSLWKVYYVDANGDGSFQTGEQINNMLNYLEDNPDVEQSDIMESTTKTYSQATEHYTGQSAIPDVRGAFNLAAGYKGFSLSAQFLYSIGGYSYDGAYASLMHNRVVGNNNWHTDILNRWQQPGDMTSVPRLSNNLEPNSDVTGSSTRFITKSDFLAFNNVQLAYSVPGAFTESMGLNSLTISLSGDNLFLLSERDGFNPSTAEAGQSNTYRYSPLSTFTAGVRVNF
ncbi:SusC/RagA family TonB-linked outer membrane protein [Zunongwangia sp. F260]|uniref:SusC/RagA family TonB-linked outer membrane protein n=1 Tax=Autumnicola lenta TaxID=3075593 RepID=A0ABU3CHA0_9FLAO|nr:SusC/RagA family TonB-linked outer membrane protein [Zunongwangia sp. F260]MDT0645727.1 SusC/RagA family TonB-linked outer membrane protein [Zunongwangia sp. F260]